MQQQEIGLKGRRIKGGFGFGVTALPGDIYVGAFVVTNAIGDVVNPRTKEFYLEKGDYNLNKRHITENIKELFSLFSMNTTLAVIATNVALEKNQLTKVAELTHDGMARAIFPVYTMMDGDAVFALSSHSGERKKLPGVSYITVIDMVGIAAQDVLMKAIKNSLLYAEGIGGFPALIQVEG